MADDDKPIDKGFRDSNFNNSEAKMSFQDRIKGSLSSAVTTGIKENFGILGTMYEAKQLGTPMSFKQALKDAAIDGIAKQGSLASSVAASLKGPSYPSSMLGVDPNVARAIDTRVREAEAHFDKKLHSFGEMVDEKFKTVDNEFKTFNKELVKVKDSTKSLKAEIVRLKQDLGPKNSADAILDRHNAVQDILTSGHHRMMQNAPFLRAGVGAKKLAVTTAASWAANAWETTKTSATAIAGWTAGRAALGAIGSGIGMAAGAAATGAAAVAGSPVLLGGMAIAGVAAAGYGAYRYANSGTSNEGVEKKKPETKLTSGAVDWSNVDSEKFISITSMDNISLTSAKNITLKAKEITLNADRIYLKGKVIMDGQQGGPNVPNETKPGETKPGQPPALKQVPDRGTQSRSSWQEGPQSGSGPVTNPVFPGNERPPGFPSARSGNSGSSGGNESNSGRGSSAGGQSATKSSDTSSASLYSNPEIFGQGDKGSSSGDSTAIIPGASKNLVNVKPDGRTATTRYNNPGGAYPRADLEQFGMTGYGVIRGNHPIAQYPSDAHGAAANMAHFKILNPVGATIGEARNMWVNGKRGGFMDLPGMDSKQVITKEDLDNPEFMHKWMKSTAKAEGFGRPLKQETLDKAFSYYQNPSSVAGSDKASAEKSTTDPSLKGRPDAGSFFTAKKYDEAFDRKLGKAVENKDDTVGGLTTGLPAKIASKAQELAKLGDVGAVKKFMSDQGYPAHGGAWCGDFVSAVLKSQGAADQIPKNSPTASVWRNFGEKVEGDPMPGDIAVRRVGFHSSLGDGQTGNPGAHVTSVQSFDPKNPKSFKSIGGNQSSFVKDQPMNEYEFRRAKGAKDKSLYSLKDAYRVETGKDSEETKEDFEKWKQSKVTSLKTENPNRPSSGNEGQTKTGAQSEGDSPSRMFFRTGENYTKDEVDGLIKKHGKNIVIGGDPNGAGYDDLAKHVTKQGARNHSYYLGPGEPKDGYEHNGKVEFGSDQKEIADHTEKMGISRKQWDDGKWVDWHKQKLLDQKKSGIEPYSVEWDNINTLKPGKLVEVMADYQKWADENGIKTKLMPKNFDKKQAEAVQAAVKSGQLRDDVMPNYHVQENDKGVDFKSAHKFAQDRNAGLVVTNDSHNYRTTDEGVALPKDKRERRQPKPTELTRKEPTAPEAPVTPINLRQSKIPGQPPLRQSKIPTTMDGEIKDAPDQADPVRDISPPEPAANAGSSSASADRGTQSRSSWQEPAASGPTPDTIIETPTHNPEMQKPSPSSDGYGQTNEFD